MLSKKEKAILKSRMQEDSRKLCTREVKERAWKALEAEIPLKKGHSSRRYRDND